MGLNPCIEQVGGDAGDGDEVVEGLGVETGGVRKAAREGCKEREREFGDGSGRCWEDSCSWRW